MEKVALGIGIALILLGVGTFAASENRAATALIPAYIGAIIALLGLAVFLKSSARKHAMHAAAAVALLSGVMSAWQCVKGVLNGMPRPMATVSQAITALLCLAFVVLAVKSFKAARRARESGLAS